VALGIADRGYVLQTGEVVLSGPAGDLLNNEAMKRAYLGDI
jgi:branched-chain amino acid transport system ATP-binding protein